MTDQAVITESTFQLIGQKSMFLEAALATPLNAIEQETIEALTAFADEQQPADSACAEPARPRYILSRSWVEKHLNSDGDLKFFSGGAVIR